MTHLHPKQVKTVHNRQQCRRGDHLFGRAQHIGGGIVRQVCLVCSRVTIDLTALADEGETGDTAHHRGQQSAI